MKCKPKIKEELAKAKARLSAYHDIPVNDIQIKPDNAQQRWEISEGESIYYKRLEASADKKFTMKTNCRMHGTNLIKV